MAIVVPSGYQVDNGCSLCISCELLAAAVNGALVHHGSLSWASMISYHVVREHYISHYIAPVHHADWHPPSDDDYVPSVALPRAWKHHSEQHSPWWLAQSNRTIDINFVMAIQRTKSPADDRRIRERRRLVTKWPLISMSTTPGVMRVNGH